MSSVTTMTPAQIDEMLYLLYLSEQSTSPSEGLSANNPQISPDGPQPVDNAANTTNASNDLAAIASTNSALVQILQQLTQAPSAQVTETSTTISSNQITSTSAYYTDGIGGTRPVTPLEALIVQQSTLENSNRASRRHLIEMPNKV